eukprot:5461115-Amphidinium_carterae.1
MVMVSGPSLESKVEPLSSTKHGRVLFANLVRTSADKGLSRHRINKFPSVTDTHPHPPAPTPKLAQN